MYIIEYLKHRQCIKKLIEIKSCLMQYEMFYNKKVTFLLLYGSPERRNKYVKKKNGLNNLK